MVAVSQFAAPKGRGALFLVCALHHPARPPRTQPSGTARPHSGLRMTPFRWAPQEPTKVATVSQFAAPRDGEASFFMVVFV